MKLSSFVKPQLSSFAKRRICFCLCFCLHPRTPTESSPTHLPGLPEMLLLRRRLRSIRSMMRRHQRWSSRGAFTRSSQCRTRSHQQAGTYQQIADQAIQHHDNLDSCNGGRLPPVQFHGIALSGNLASVTSTLQLVCPVVAEDAVIYVTVLHPLMSITVKLVALDKG
jgi:hypothetical protein